MTPLSLLSLVFALVGILAFFSPSGDPHWDGVTAITRNTTRANNRKAARHIHRSNKLAQTGAMYARVPIDWPTFNANQTAHRFARVLLRSADFLSGTLIVREPALLELAEPITVDFNADNDARPTPAQLAPNGTHPYAQGYALDFIAGIVVIATNATIDGRGHSMQMAPRLLDKQGHYAHICVSELSFIRGEGPGNSGSSLRAASNLIVRNIDLRDTSHHGIHGHGAASVTLLNVGLYNYSVAALSLNGWSDVYAHKVVGHGSSALARLNGRFTQARFGVRFLEECESLMSRMALVAPFAERPQFAAAARECGTRLVELNEAMAHAWLSYADVPASVRELFFSVTDGVLDGGTARGFVITDKGAEVHVPGDRFVDGEGSDNILFEDCAVRDTVSDATQVIGVRYPDGSGVGGGYSQGTSSLGAIMNGPVGDVFDIERLLRLGLNPLSRAQLALSDAAHLYDTLGRSAPLERRRAFGHSNISPGVIAAARLASIGGNTPAVETALAALYTAGDIVYQFDSDPQAHTPKGTIAVSVSCSRTVSLVRFDIAGVEARGDAGLSRRMPGQSESDVVPPSEWTYANGGHPLRGSLVGYNGADATGLLLSGNTDVRMSGLTISGVTSRNGVAHEVVRL